MRYALVSLILGVFTAAFRIFTPNIVDDQTYIDAFMTLNLAAIMGSLSFGVNARVDRDSMKNQLINFDIASAVILGGGFLSFYLLTDRDVTSSLLLLVISICFGFHESISNIFNYRKNFAGFLVLELLYSVCVISVFLGMAWNSLIILVIILIVRLRAKPLKVVWHKIWKIRDRIGIGCSTIITYLVPVIFSLILNKDDAVSFLSAFALASLVGNVSITIQQKTSLAHGSVSRGAILLHVLFTLISSYFLLISAGNFEILGYMSSSAGQSFSIALFVGSRVLHTSSILYDRLNLDGCVNLFVLQIKRITLMAFMGVLIHSISGNIPLLLLTLTAVNIWFSIGVLVKK